MQRLRKLGMVGFVAALLIVICVNSQTTQRGGTDYDVQHYKIDAELVPAEQLLKARAEVTFVPASETRSAVFEINGSLTVKRITRTGGVPTTNPTAATPRPGTRDLRPRAIKDPKKEIKANNLGPAENGVNAAQTAASPDGLQFIQDRQENLNGRI